MVFAQNVFWQIKTRNDWQLTFCCNGMCGEVKRCWTSTKVLGKPRLTATSFWNSSLIYNQALIHIQALQSRQTNPWNSIQLYRRVGLTLSSCTHCPHTLETPQKRTNLWNNSKLKGPPTAKHLPTDESWRRQEKKTYCNYKVIFDCTALLLTELKVGIVLYPSISIS